jgi:hypothetical protein
MTVRGEQAHEHRDDDSDTLIPIRKKNYRLRAAGPFVASYTRAKSGRRRVHLSDEHTNVLTQLARWSHRNRSHTCAEQVACGSALRTLPGEDRTPQCGSRSGRR